MDSYWLVINNFELWGKKIFILPVMIIIKRTTAAFGTLPQTPPTATPPHPIPPRTQHILFRLCEVDSSVVTNGINCHVVGYTLFSNMHIGYAWRMQRVNALGGLSLCPHTLSSSEFQKITVWLLHVKPMTLSAVVKLNCSFGETTIWVRIQGHQIVWKLENHHGDIKLILLHSLIHIYSIIGSLIVWFMYY